MYTAELRLAILLVFVAFIVYLAARQSRSRLDVLRLHLEARNRLIDRFGDAEAFLAFAGSDDGKAALRTPEIGAAGHGVAGLRLFQSGVLCLAVGAGSLFVSRASSSLSGGEAHGLGVILICAGVGLLLSGLLAWFAARPPRGERR